jgi:hypothetical protein
VTSVAKNKIRATMRMVVAIGHGHVRVYAQLRHIKNAMHGPH